MLRIGIIGLGDIFKKAYLPYLGQVSEVEWHLFTRQTAVLNQVADRLSHSKTYDSLEDLHQANLDGVMIHAATVAHYDIAKAFLERGIPVYMDKPITEDYQQTAALYQLAEKHSTFLVAGFNRRFAPKVLKMAEQADKVRIAVEKNDVNRLGDFQYKLFDFFIHPLDTALFLAHDKPIAGSFSYALVDNQLQQVQVTLETATSTVLASMNLQSGSRREVMEVQTPDATYHLENLDNLTIYKGFEATKDGFGSWDTTLYKRGFESIIVTFLQAVKTGISPVSRETSLLSHWICEQIKQSESTSGQLNFNLPD